MKLGISGGLCTALLLGMVSTPGLAGETRTTICELARNGRALSGKQVRLTVVYISDLTERSALLDRNCPEKIVGIHFTAKKPDQSVGEFREAFEGRLEDLEVRQFVVEVSGRFTWRSPQERYGFIEIQKVWSYRRIHGDWKISSKPTWSGDK